MPPRHTGATTNSSTKTVATVRARKRKNVDRSDEELDSDFDYSHTTRVQRTDRSSKKLVRHNSQNPASNGNGEEQESWRAELSEMKRVKQFTEEDRGFVFTRKKTGVSQNKGIAAGLSLKTGSSARSVNDPDLSILSSPYPPLTPEGTPSRDRAYDMRVPAAKTQGARQPKQAPSQHLRHQQQQQHTPTGNQESFVTIPMRETPTIQRNKDLRSVSRRSSFNMRGKRASSIGNGFAALPHPSVDPKSFFRHIAADGPPPVRMKQLMSWCARKCIDSQKSSSKDALAIAKKIEEEALDMLIGGKFSVSWYSRPPDTEAASKKPHHQNVENQIKLKECETMVAKLKREDEEWTRIISSFNTFHATLLDSGAILPSADEGIVVSETFADNIEVELLSADERSLLEKHCKHKDAAETDSGSTSKTPRDASDSTNRSAKDDNKWMKDMINSLEKEVDDLHDTLYAASRFDKIARQYTDQVLEQVAFALDERQRPSLQDNPLMLLPSSSSSSAPPSSLTSSSSGSASKGKGSSLKPASPTTSTSASIGSIPSIGSDSADDPRQILRALSRLSL